MPDPVHILTALLVAALAAAGIRLTASPTRAAGGGVVAAGVGFLLGCLMLSLEPRWPPQEGLDRLLLILLPMILVVELLAALPGWLARFFVSDYARRAERVLVWLLRGAVVASAAFVLLYDTSYLTEWSPAETWSTFAVLATALAALWIVLTLVAQHGVSRAAPLALAVAATGGAIAVMLSGIATDGQIGLALAAALIGAVVVPGPAATSGMVGVGTVTLFALVVIGRFFGELTTLNAVLLFAAPALCAVPELPYVRRLWPVVRGGIGVALSAVPVAVALWLAQAGPPRPADRPPTDIPEPALDDYLQAAG